MVIGRVHSGEAKVHAQELFFFMRDAEIRAQGVAPGDGRAPCKRPLQLPAGASLDGVAVGSQSRERHRTTTIVLTLR